MRVPVFCLFILLSTSAQAALPPLYQNNKDFDVMVDWVRAHPQVMESLRRIDFETYTVHFGRDCEAIFTREPQKDAVPGPAPPLRFDNATCPVD